ncbi:MAG: glycosyltransferase [Nostoc sp. DedVER02]|uniref:glycosyltransferase n=1 Tax=unclassified Nostoc TaxID=2593658 RepID=UPI002AD4575C|nr:MULTISPECIES: glycosyltransferase [unclassified Nostoc]MDZ7988015.1 glycosyltransferase [Nostoc sp. DedVER02]MDZ8114940.1 glycosyltransferase [Nostoc sp. DedVER01b]
MKPLVSVIIPCYNAERFLTETIESVFSQTFTDYEIILVDDGSTDGTAEVIKSFGSKVRAEFGSNRGASAARNHGTALAKGKFIQYLDADDLLRNNALERRVNALEVSNADVAYSDWQRLEENEAGEFSLGNVIARQIEDVHADSEIALFTDFWSPPAALLYHRRIVEAIGAWNESLPIIQDARFLLDAALMGGKFVYVPGVQADYRVHKANSLSRRNPTKFVLDCFNNACQVEEFWKVNGGITPERQVSLEKVYGGVARFFFEYDRSKFYEILTRIHNLNPNYLPSGPRTLRQLSKWFGYEQAEAIAFNYRRLKHFVHSLTKKLPITST